jgi:hypothetical protein
MRLTELEPRFLKIVDERTFRTDVDAVAEADGVMFVCPLCLKNAAMTRPGVHSVICWRPHVPQTVTPGPGRWDFSGTGFGDLTLTAGSSSISLTGPGCGAHFFITNGEILLA